MPIPQIERRRIEAEILAHVYDVLLRDQGEEVALKAVADAVAASSRQAGRLFAAAAPAPSLDHFATITDAWQDSGALIIRNRERHENMLRFEVAKCAYAQLYADMGLPPRLAVVLSCSRDAPFAEAYSPSLIFSRSRTIAEGAPSCLFTFCWKD